MIFNRSMAEEIIERSNTYPKAHFGLHVGDGWPEFVTEALKSEKLTIDLGLHFMMNQITITSPEVHARLFSDMGKHTATNPILALAQQPEVYEVPLKYLFWGIQLGRQMAEVDRLETMSTMPHAIAKGGNL